MTNEEYCHYSDLPSPMAYINIKDDVESEIKIDAFAIDRIIEMAWEDRAYCLTQYKNKCTG